MNTGIENKGVEILCSIIAQEEFGGVVDRLREIMRIEMDRVAQEIEQEAYDLCRLDCQMWDNLGPKMQEFYREEARNERWPNRTEGVA
jgi:hypothetical protein